MNCSVDAFGPWPDLAPPPQAIHLMHSYDSLKARLLSQEGKESVQVQQYSVECSKGPYVPCLSWQSSLSALLPLQSSASPCFTGLCHNPNTLVSVSRHKHRSKGSHKAVVRRNSSPMGGRGWSPAARCSPSSTRSPAATRETEQLEEGNLLFPQTQQCLLDSTDTEISKSMPEPRQTHKDVASTRRDPVEPSGQRRAHSSKALESPLPRSAFNSSPDKKEAEDANISRGRSAPQAVGSLLMRLQRRSSSTRTSNPFSWRRPRQQAAVAPSVLRSRSSNYASGGAWKWDGNMLVPGEDAKTRALRREALERVRQRAREAREKQRQDSLSLQLEQEQQQQRSQELSRQLMQRTLQRIRENAVKQEEQRQEQLILQQKMMQQAEERKKYCAQHRRALQQKLIRQQREIKNKIRTRAEESVRQSREAKARSHSALGVACP